jgi:GTP-binding protein
LFAAVGVIDREMERRVETPQLNKMLTRALDSYPPPFSQGKRFKIFYAFQKSLRPPTFTLFVNDAGCLTPHYRRFLIDKLRASWGFTGCPVLLELKHRQRRDFVKSSPDRRDNEKKW